MNADARPTPPIAQHELLFQSLVREGGHCVFPCDPDGHVDMDALTHRQLLDYLFARTTVGREFLLPVVSHAGAARF